jgi:glycosyltransferase involved in cell wall biosynthesis
MTTDAVRAYLKSLYTGVFSDKAFEAHLEDYVGFTFANQVTPLLKNHLPEGGRVLDVGAGFGSYVLSARRLGYAAYGLEIAPFEVEQARVRLAAEIPGIDAQDVFRQGDGQSLPFEDASFDAVSLWNVIEHVPDRQKLLDEIYRVLKPDGRLFIIAPNYAALRQEAHYQVPWIPYLPRALAPLYLKMWGKNPTYYEKGIFPCTNQQVLTDLRARGFSLRPLFAAPLERPQRGETISAYLKVRLDDPEQVETGWKRTFLRLLKRLHMRWVIWRLLELRASFRLALAWLEYARRWWAFENPWVPSMLVEAQKPGSRLLVMVPDILADVVDKGEYQPRYYNPGGFFDEIHLLATNEGPPVAAEAMQHTVGPNAHLQLYAMPEPTGLVVGSPFFKRWLLSPWAGLLRWWAVRQQRRQLDQWAQNAVDLARRIRPALVRCHANDYNAYAASRIKRALGIPYVVSLHINPDANPRRRTLDPNAPWQDRLFARLFEDVEVIGLKQADLVLPVYQPIVPYLERVGVQRYEVAYNVLSEELRCKEDYTLHKPVRLISIGRHFDLKNPVNILRAVKEIPEAHLTLVGDGPYQAQLETQAAELELGAQVTFEPSVANRDLVRRLPEYDIFVIHTEHWELSKALLEALLSGLPVVMNYRQDKGGDPPELAGGEFVCLVENSMTGYHEAVSRLINNDAERTDLGHSACAHARARWAPDKTEAKYVDIYQRILAGGKARANQ